MPLLSVITAAHPGRTDLLIEAGESLATQQLPAGWEVEWLLQEDGELGVLRAVSDRFDFARYDSVSTQLGIAVTRNLALTRARGELVHALDSDDLLLPHAVATAIEAFEARPQIHWVSGQADDLLPDGTRVPYPPLIGPGLIEPGVVDRHMAEVGLPPIACPGLTMRTTTVRMLGGWAANPRWEDSALFAGLAALTPGWVTDTVTWLYRQHDGQTTRGPEWTHLQAELWEMVMQRSRAALELAPFLRYAG
ncbi:glycosyltransferase family A protein [Nocardia neocaledoniensis]|uniref:glycosyltransferase family A protein n=1 Tax=Nocardia neocaledoniensis TaxID=236511 RepID=UPI0033C5B96B